MTPAEPVEAGAFDKLRHRRRRDNGSPPLKMDSAMPYMYILECADGSYYTGSTRNLEGRLLQHEQGLGARHTAKRLPVKLVYYEYFDRVEEAFFREKQVQGWSRRKKLALIEGATDKLPMYSRNYTQYGPLASTSSASVGVPEAVPEPVEGTAGFDRLSRQGQQFGSAAGGAQGESGRAQR